MKNWCERTWAFPLSLKRPELFLCALFAVALLALSANAVEKIETHDDSKGYTMQTYVYKQVNGLDIKLDVYQPAGEGQRPAIMYIHGGALINGSRYSSYAEEKIARYVADGYVVASIDYRLAPETKLAGIVEDVEDAYYWLLREGASRLHIDPDRIAFLGGSAGGYLTLTAGFRVSPRPKALVSFYGYGDVTGDWYAKPDPYYLQQPLVDKEVGLSVLQGKPIANTDGLSEEQMRARRNFYLYCRQNGLWPHYVGGRNPEANAGWFAGYEARPNVTADYPPTLLLHGGGDTDVPFSQSVKMAEVLERYGVEHELITKPEWGHGFNYRDEPEVREAQVRVLSFLGKHLK